MISIYLFFCGNFLKFSRIFIDNFIDEYDTKILTWKSQRPVNNCLVRETRRR